MAEVILDTVTTEIAILSIDGALPEDPPTVIGPRVKVTGVAHLEGADAYSWIIMPNPDEVLWHFGTISGYGNTANFEFFRFNRLVTDSDIDDLQYQLLFILTEGAEVDDPENIGTVFTPKPEGYSIGASVDAIIDLSTMTISGTGYSEGGIGTAWKILDANGEIVKTGLGPVAVFEFHGTQQWYSIVFRDQYGDWGTPELFYPQAGPQPDLIEKFDCSFRYINMD